MLTVVLQTVKPRPPSIKGTLNAYSVFVSEHITIHSTVPIFPRAIHFSRETEFIRQVCTCAAICRSTVRIRRAQHAIFLRLP